MRSLNEQSTVTIVIPTRNEEGSISVVLDEVRRVWKNSTPPEILVVDSSDDSTASIASVFGARVIRTAPAGKGAAVAVGVQEAESQNIIVIDGDGSHRPSEIPTVLFILDRGALVAKGSRFLTGGGTYDMSTIRKIGNLFFVKLFRLAGFRVTDLCYGFVGFKKTFWERVSPVASSLAFDVNLVSKGLFFNEECVVEFPSVERKRYAGWAKSDAIRTGLEVVTSIADAIVASRRIRRLERPRGTGD